MKPKHLLSDFIEVVFSVISFFIMVFSIITNDDTIWSSISFIYIFPKTISAVNKITTMPYNKSELIMNVMATIMGAIIIILLLVISSTSLFSEGLHDGLKLMVTLFSAFFVFMEVYDLIHELTKYVNLHNQIMAYKIHEEK